MTERLNQVMSMNPTFARALANGEDWALRQAESIRGIDDQASRRHPERAHKEDGRPHNWCGACPHKDGCMMCDLDEPDAATYRSLKPVIGTYTD